MKRLILILLFMFMIVPSGFCKGDSLKPSKTCSQTEYFFGTYELLSASPDLGGIKYSVVTHGYDTIGVESIDLKFLKAYASSTYSSVKIKMLDLGPRMLSISVYVYPLSTESQTELLYVRNLLVSTDTFTFNIVTNEGLNADQLGPRYYIKISSMQEVKCNSKRK